jgi:hypothetical protein
MRTSAQRIAKYNARMQSSLIDPTLSAVQALQQANYSDYVNDFYPKQLAMRAVLETYSMPVPMIAGFEAFHGEIYHLYKTVSGILLTAAMQIIVTKWADAMHLGPGNKAVLIDICLTVYGIVVV